VSNARHQVSAPRPYGHNSTTSSNFFGARVVHVDADSGYYSAEKGFGKEQIGNSG
jgi:hypothetical protein